MTTCVRVRSDLPPARKRASYPAASAFSAPVSPVGSTGASPIFAPLSLNSPASSPRGSFSLASSTKSLPSLALYSERTSVTSPISPIEAIEAEQRSPPLTPKALKVAEDGPSTSTSKEVTPRKSTTDLKRSTSMPLVAEGVAVAAMPDSPLFPPTSSSKESPRASDGAASIDGVSSAEDGSPEGSRKPRISVDTSPKSFKRRSSSTVRDALPSASPLIMSARQRKISAREEASQPMSSTSSAAASSTGWGSSRPPSRPPSAYSEPVIPSTPGLARRLSLSASRRGSENVVQQSKRVVIRDYGFPPSDPRFWGEGQATLPSVSRTPSELWAPSSNSSRGQLASWDEVANEVQEELSSRGSASTFSWGFITSHAEADVVDQLADSPLEEEEDATEPINLGPIPEGGALYLATYAFEPEADQEMRLDEGEVVRVYERICQGWLVAGRLKKSGSGEESEEETGLVPENYLTQYREEVL